MDKEVKEREKRLLHEAKKQSRKLDLLLAENERQVNRLKELEDAKSSTTNKDKSFKSPKI